MEASDKTAVTIETIINAPIEEVWAAWINPAQIINWFGSDPGGTGLAATLNVQQGGAFEITFADSDKTEHTCSGVYAEIQEFRKLTFSWAWKSEPGVESFVELSLAPVNGLTRMLFTHSNLGAESKHNYRQGWQATFLKLERLLTK